jgi:hypothetical protein
LTQSKSLQKSSEVEKVEEPKQMDNENTEIVASEEQATVSTNIKMIYDLEVDKLMETNPVTYQFKSDNLVENADKHYGFIAQELEQIYPELVEHNDLLKCKTINYLELIPLIICKMQKMQTQIDELLNSKN